MSDKISSRSSRYESLELKRLANPDPLSRRRRRKARASGSKMTAATGSEDQRPGQSETIDIGDNVPLLIDMSGNQNRSGEVDMAAAEAEGEQRKPEVAAVNVEDIDGGSAVQDNLCLQGHEEDSASRSSGSVWSDVNFGELNFLEVTVDGSSFYARCRAVGGECQKAIFWGLLGGLVACAVFVSVIALLNGQETKSADIRKHESTSSPTFAGAITESSMASDPEEIVDLILLDFSCGLSDDNGNDPCISRERSICVRRKGTLNKVVISARVDVSEPIQVCEGFVFMREV